MKITITLPSKLHEKLIIESKIADVPLNRLIVEALTDHVNTVRKPVDLGPDAWKDIGRSTLQAGLAAVMNRIGGGK